MKFAVLFFLSASAFAANSPVSVKIDFLEALAPKDTTSSERFQKEYDGAISTSKKLLSEKLSKCGYEIKDSTVFYSASDAVEALEKGKKSEADSAWLLVGPRRSNHYVLLTQGAPNTPSVSTMASSDEVAKLPATHLSISPNNQQMAKVAALEAKKLAKKNKNYVSLVSEDCVSCVDFANHFNGAAKSAGLKLFKEIKINGENPDLSVATKEIAVLKPAFVLLPNYSKITAMAIAAIHKVNSEAFFVGGDGWGDSRFGFVQNAKDLEGTAGFTVRGFPTTDVAIEKMPLIQEIKNSKDSSLQLPASAPTLAIFKIMQGTVDLLCKHKPKDKLAFKSAFEKHGSKAYKSPWGISVYGLKDGDIKYLRSVKSE